MKRKRIDPLYKAYANVVNWIESTDDDGLFLSVLVAGALGQGVERIRLRDPVQAERLERWLHALVEDYRERLLPVDLRVAELWGA